MNKQQLANKIWESANKMRSKIDASEYKDYILGFMFYKFLSDTEVKYFKDKGYTEEDIQALSLGAQGIQVGTAFALTSESGMEKSLKERLIDAVLKGLGRVKTDPLASPTGFVFKVVELEDTTGVEDTYLKRTRICDLGYLREAYRKENGKLGYRCPSEPVEDYVKKGGKIEDTVGRKCLCNGLVSTMGLAQERRSGEVEMPIIKEGDDLKFIKRFLKMGEKTYTAQDVIQFLLGKTKSM